MFKRFGLVALLVWMPLRGLIAQVELPEFLGLAGGLSLTFGTHVNRIGINLQGYYRRDFVQVNLHAGGFYQFREFGPSPAIPGWEGQLGVGGLLGFGPGSERWHQPFLHVISNQTLRPYALAYGCLWYVDQRNTTQFSGSIAAHIQGLQLVIENDVFFGGIEDKYRTGAFRVAYQRDSLLIGTRVILWTGNTRSKAVKRVRPSETDYPGRFGYKDLTHATYGRFSHGIFAFEGRIALPFGQVVSGEIGLDHERIRHLFQNRLIHDMYWMPKSWIKARNPHIPMLDQEGLPYLFRAGQRLRRVRPYASFGLNRPMFY